MTNSETTNNPANNQQPLTVEQAYANAVEHFNAERFEDADKVCTAIIQAEPDHIDTRNLLGVIAQRINRHDLAIEQFEHAIALINNNPLLLHNLGISLHQTGRVKDAEQTLRKALAIDPDNRKISDYLHTVLNHKNTVSGTDSTEGALQRAIMCHHSGDLESAAHWYKQTLDSEPDNAVALTNMSIILQNQGRSSEAITNYRKAISGNPNYSIAHNNLGNALVEQNNLDEAVACYQKAIAIDPDYSDAHSNLGNALIDQGKLDEAVSCLQKALAIKPDFLMASENLNTAMGKRVENYIFDLSGHDQEKFVSAEQLISENGQLDSLKTNLLFCPFVDPITPPLGIASLKAYLEKYGDARINCMDLNIEWHSMLTRDERPDLDPLRKGDILFKGSNDSFFNIDKYQNVSSGFASLLHKTHKSQQYSMCLGDHPQDDDTLNFLETLALRDDPDVIGFSILFDSQILCSLLLARQIKKKYPKLIMVFGGAGLVNLADQIIENSFIDFVVTDAGEASFNSLLASIKSGKFDTSIPGVSYKNSESQEKNRPVTSNLDHNAYPDFSDFDMKQYFTNDVVIPILSSKGCYWRRCSFCEEGSLNLYSEASVNRVIDEIEHHYSSGRRYFQFIDEMIAPKRLRQISQKIIDRNMEVYFYGTLRPSADFDLETLQLMFKAGFRFVLWGVESCNRRVLKLINKGTSLKSIRNTLQYSRQAGIVNHIFTFVGFPSETPDELFDTMQFIYDNKANIHQVHSGTFQLCRGTEIFMNPEKFGAKIEYFGKNVNEYKATYKQGTTTPKSEKYFLHYFETFIKKTAIVYEFGIFRDHALLYYAKYPVDQLEDIRQEIPQPVPIHFP